MGATLVINPGSSSQKYALYEAGVAVLEWRYEATVRGFECSNTIKATGQTAQTTITEAEYQQALARVAIDVVEYLETTKDDTALTAVVVRVVAPGTYFQSHRRVDDAFMKQLRDAEQRAPLHIPHTRLAIERCRAVFPTVPLIAASDSAFHRTLPARAREYSLIATDSTELDIHRFGYHGLSVASVVRQLPNMLGQLPEKLVVCHLGSGASVTAVEAGKSVETTMGYSPASGLVMSSRAGDLDAAGLLALMRERALSVADAELYLNSQGGLAGLAGQADIRQLLDQASHHNTAAETALDTFAYHIQTAIAAATVALGGMDVLVFTATAGVRSSELRARIMERLAHFGIEVHDERNAVTLSKGGVISRARSQVTVVVLPTDEMGEMARVAEQVMVNE